MKQAGAKTVRALLPAALFLMLAPCVGGGEGKAEQGPAQVHALLIGCARYPALQKRSRLQGGGVPNPRLRGPERDVVLIRETLLGLGVDAKNLRVLSTHPDTPDAQKPTRENIVRELRSLPARVVDEPDAQVLVLYAGHGTQEWDDPEGDEVDGMDEAWCPMDTDLVEEKGRRAWRNLLLDDELSVLLRAVRDAGALVWLALDCCHAGTGIRGAEGASRGLPAPRPPRGFAVGRSASATLERTPLDREELDGIVAFYGSRSFEKLHEVRIREAAGRFAWHGPLSVAIARGLTVAGEHLPDLTFAELHTSVLQTYRDLGRLDSAHPQAEGDLSRRVFRRGRVRVPRMQLRRRGGGALALSAGAIHGVRVGSEVTVFGTGSRGRAEARLGTALVRQVLAHESACEPPPGKEGEWARTDGAAARLWDAEVTEPAVGPGVLRLALRDARGHLADREAMPVAYRSLFAEENGDPAGSAARFGLTSSPDRADWWVLLGEGGLPRQLRRRHAASDPYGIGPGGPGSAAGPGDLEHHLWSVYRGETVLDLFDRGVLPRLPRDPAVLDLRVREVRPDGVLREVSDGSTLTPGTTLRLELLVHAGPTQQEGREESYDVFVFWLDPGHGFHQLHPRGTLPATLSREKERSIPLYFGSRKDTVLTDLTVGMEHLLVFAMPRAGAPGAPLDLAFLARRPVGVRGEKRKGFVFRSARQLHDLAFGLAPRGADRWADDDRASEALMLHVLRWQTAWGPLRAPPRTHDEPAIPAVENHRIDSPIPDPWAFGDDIRLERAGTGVHEAWCALVSESEDAVHVLVDLDGEEWTKRPPAAETRTRWVRERAFDAEMGFRRESNGRTVVWYDTDDDGRMDWALIDVDGDRRSDASYRGSTDAWGLDGATDLSLLRTTRLPVVWKRTSRVLRALSRLRTLTGPP